MTEPTKYVRKHPLNIALHLSEDDTNAIRLLSMKLWPNRERGNIKGYLEKLVLDHIAAKVREGVLVAEKRGRKKKPSEDAA